MTIVYHAGQIEVQTEANTRRVAGMLADWVGPVGEFARVADLIVLAMPTSDGGLAFTVVSGQAPLVRVEGGAAIRLPLGPAPPGIASMPTPVGGLAVNLGQRRRARINGRLIATSAGEYLIETREAFTNCRKYIAPSIALDAGIHVGPLSRVAIALDDPWLADVLARAETSFLATISPDGQPDASHRGGPPGFLSLNVRDAQLSWPEYVGDGMLKSAGNVRATGHLTLLAVDLDTGDGVELAGVGRYETLRSSRRPRLDGLEQHREPFPVQGAMTMDVSRAFRVKRVISPRQRVEKAEKITSCSSIDEQAPQ